MMMISKQTLYVALSILSLFLTRSVRADDDYDIGNPTVKDIWVDPVNGKDGPGRGTTRALALKSVRYAWAFIPTPDTLVNEGFRIDLAPGTYLIDDVPTQFQSVYGTADYPVIFQAADDTGSVNFPSIDVSLCSYFYMIGVHITASQSSYTSTFSGCDHLLFRKCQFISADSTSSDTAFFGASFYQCQHMYFEHCELANSSGAAMDIFASQYGHIKNCSIHHFGGNGIYLRGGSGYMTIEENTIGFGAQGGIVCSSHDTTSGLDNMVMPWVHYDIYDVKCFNNIIHHTQDAGFSCSGGYNVLFAFNTLYQTGLMSSLVTLNLASHACSRDKDVAHARIDSGAWGTYYYDFLDSSKAPIPNKNVFVYNNIFYNTGDSSTASSQFSISGPLTALAVTANCPRPAYADDDLVIRGNIIWNGKSDKDLGITSTSGCGSANPTCNEKQLDGQNLVNAAEPTFVDPVNGNFHPKHGSVVFTISKSVAIPDFSWTGLPPSPKEPPGNISNSILIDRDSVRRNSGVPICGAFVITTSSVSGQSAAEDEISLLQNYPNPAREITTIGFHLLRQSRATLEVFNILGERVASLISGMLDEGDHSIEWNTSNVGTGEYFCRLSTASMTQTKQITVVR